MMATFYAMPSAVPEPWNELNIRMSNQVISYDYTAQNTKTGSFSLVLPYSAALLADMKLNGIIFIDGDWLMIENIKYNYRTITASGRDCKAFLSLRLTEIPQVQTVEGYDAFSGKTAACIKHYLDGNLISPENAARRLPVTWIGSKSTGITDHYLARLTPLSDIADTLCSNAGLGWRLSGGGQPGFVFTLKEPVDRSYGQTQRPRIIFSVSWGNVTGLEFEHDISNQLNEVYADHGGYISTYFTTFAEPSGIQRRECSTDVSADVPADEVGLYAIESVRENTVSQSYELTVPANCGYGDRFELGDIVSVYDIATGNFFNDVLQSVTKSFQSGRMSYRFVLGKQKPRLLNRIVNSLERR